MAGRRSILVLVGVVNLPVITIPSVVEHLHGLDADAAGIDPAMRSRCAEFIAGYLLLFMTLSLMRMRN